MKKKIIAVIMMLMLVSSNIAMAQAETIEYEKYKNFKYVYADWKSINIKYYIGKKSNVSIPEKINGKKVRYVYLIKAKNLKNIKLSRYVKDAHLARNEKLKKVTVSKKNKYLSVKNNIVLNKKKTKLLSVLGGYDEIVIPKTVKKVGNCSFYGSKVKKVIITKNVKKIETEAFLYCKKLREIVFTGDTIPKIEETAIYSYLDEMKFYVKNEKLAKDLIKELEGKFYLNACVYVGDKLVYEKEISKKSDMLY